MRNTLRYISAIVAAALVSGSMMTAWAQDKKNYTDEEKAAIKTKKQVIDNGDGTYQLKLETFVTGDSSNVFQRKTTQAKPMDIVLVLDVSGSMDDPMKRIVTPAHDDTTALSSTSYNYNNYSNNSYYVQHSDGNYYRVYKEAFDVYTKRASQGYSYNSYGNNEFYYLNNGNYSLVSAQKGTATYILQFTTSNNKTRYLSGTSVANNRPYNVWTPDETIWTGILYEKTTQYRMAYNVNGTVYYLSGTTTSSEPTGANSQSNTIWTGVLYTITHTDAVTENTTTKKMAALKTAVNNFIDSVSVKSDPADPHKIAIVKFASEKVDYIGNDPKTGYNYSQIVKDLTVSNAENTITLKNQINALRASGATSADYGMEHASTILGTVDTTKRKALVIMFTDGEPNHSNGFNTTVANSTINESNDLKQKGVIVYTVGTFSNITDNITNYMNYTSSNHKGATSMTASGIKVSNKYYMQADDANQINEAFNTITSEISNGGTGGEGITLDVEGENAVHLADIVTPSFKVPQGNNSVTLKMQFLDTLDLHNPADTSAYKWRSEEDVPNTVNVNVIENADTTSTIDISGFDFSANWVGPIFYEVEEGTTKRIEYDKSTVKHGAKLVIYVDITPNPEDEGGLVPTNTDKSGVYVGGVLITNDKLQDYITPEPVFTPMDLKIEIDGLGENENAIFNVKGGNLGENGMNIILTSTTDGSVASATIAKVPLRDAAGNAITYTVTLDEKWIWAYTPAEATDAPAGDKNYKTTGYTVKEHALYNAEVDADGKITNYTTNHIFRFKVAPKEGVSGHGENFKNNEFKIMPKTTSTK